MRTINAPGVEWREIDKSGYSPALVGTGCFIPLFSDKGEPYRPMEFTSRSAFEKYYGTPDNEAERYGYAAACEVLNQNGRLWCARLPYDNAAFEKVVGVKYSLRKEKDYIGLSSVLSCIDEEAGLSSVVPANGKKSKWWKIQEADGEIKDAYVIYGGRTPVLYDLSAVDEYRSDEAKVPANTFLIVDTTNATYSRVKEDYRLGQKREVIGIVPVVTTAANAMYAQSLIQLDLDEISAYEPLKDDFLKALEVYDADGKLCAIDGNELCTGGLLETDLVKRINVDSYYKNYTELDGAKIDILSTFDTYTSRTLAETAYRNYTTPGNPSYNKVLADALEGYSVAGIASAYYLSADIQVIDGWHVEFETSAELTSDALELFNKLNERARLSNFIYKCEEDANGVGIEIAKDVLEKDCIKSILCNYVYPVVCIDYKVDLSGDPIVENYLTCHIDKVERDTEYAQLLSSGTASGLSSWDREDGTVVDDEDAEAWAILSTETTSCTVPLDPSDPRYGVHGIDFDDGVPETIALDAANYFSTIQPESDGGFEADHLKDIGIVVYRCYLDPAEGNKVSYEPVEAFCGSLCKDDKDPNTGVTKFIDTIVNTNSEYINFFSNCFNDKTNKKFYRDECDILIAEPCQGAVLGLYSPMTKEDISISKSIYDGLNKAFDKVSDINKLQIDIVCDAGISNIASYLKAIFGDKGPYDLMITDDLGNSMLGMWKCKKYDDPSVKTWKTVVQKLDNFCKNVRKDCMFVTECPRPLVLQGQKKIIRDTKPANTIDANILPYLPAVCGLNTNYGAGYLDWFEMADDYTGDFFWCPPSIKAMGVMINCDVNYEYWDAPAGLNRGVIKCTDVAFSPTPKQAGPMYEKNWNYAINYPNDGVVLEGQKTFQTKPSSLDRINVRRLMLRLERAAYQVSRYFVYEGHTAYTRQRLVDALDPYFKDAKNRGGIYDYVIRCSDENNPPEVIDRNELNVQIGIKPTRTIEWILIGFVCARTGASWSEVL